MFLYFLFDNIYMYINIYIYVYIFMYTIIIIIHIKYSYLTLSYIILHYIQRHRICKAICLYHSTALTTNILRYAQRYPEDVMSSCLRVSASVRTRLEYRIGLTFSTALGRGPRRHGSRDARLLHAGTSGYPHNPPTD